MVFIDWGSRAIFQQKIGRTHTNNQNSRNHIGNDSRIMQQIANSDRKKMFMYMKEKERNGLNGVSLHCKSASTRIGLAQLGPDSHNS